MAFKTRDLLMAQRTQTINALRGHFAEYGIVVPTGPQNIRQLAAVLHEPEPDLPEAVVELGRELLKHLQMLSERI